MRHSVFSAHWGGKQFCIKQRLPIAVPVNCSLYDKKRAFRAILLVRLTWNYLQAVVERLLGYSLGFGGADCVISVNQ